MTSDTSVPLSETISQENSTNIPATNIPAETPPEQELEPTEPISTEERVTEDKSGEDPDLLIAIDPNLQPRFKTKDGKLLLILPPEIRAKDGDTPLNDWMEMWQALKHRLNGGDRFWQANTSVYLMAQDRLLDVRQLQAIADALSEAQLNLSRVYTARRQTAVAASTAGYSVEQRINLAAFNPSNNAPVQPLADPLYLETTIRSGVEIRHEGTVVIRGDVNPGGSVVADGDILVWGRLRGIVHAGARGNNESIIMALEMEPTQIRIGDYVARSPESPPEFYPEVAYVSSEGIRIAGALDFAKSSSSATEL
jgi:septum site-determining protein MinC